MQIIQKILFILFMLGALVLTYYSVDSLQQIYINTSNIFIRFGVILIFVFTLIIIIRYLLLMFFSILQTIRRSADEDEAIHTSETVSVIVPCYNEQEVILHSLKSIMNQTYKNIEILVR